MVPQMAASVSCLGSAASSDSKGSGSSITRHWSLLAYSCFFLVSSNRAATTPSPLEITVPMPTTTRQHTSRPASWRKRRRFMRSCSSFVIIAMLIFPPGTSCRAGGACAADCRAADEISLKKCPRAAPKTCECSQGPADRLKTVYHNRPAKARRAAAGPQPAKNLKNNDDSKFFEQGGAGKTRRKPKGNYGVSVNSLWQRLAKKARPGQTAGAGTEMRFKGRFRR